LDQYLKKDLFKANSILEVLFNDPDIFVPEVSIFDDSNIRNALKGRKKNKHASEVLKEFAKEPELDQKLQEEYFDFKIDQNSVYELN
jgi:hypothetical protein